jgi:hypothetical protein
VAARDAGELAQGAGGRLAGLRLLGLSGSTWRDAPYDCADRRTTGPLPARSGHGPGSSTSCSQSWLARFVPRIR